MNPDSLCSLCKSNFATKLDSRLYDSFLKDICFFFLNNLVFVSLQSVLSVVFGYRDMQDDILLI